VDLQDYIDLGMDAGKAKLLAERVKLEQLMVSIEKDRAEIRNKDAQTKKLLAQARLTNAKARKAENQRRAEHARDQLRERGERMLEELRKEGIELVPADQGTKKNVGLVVRVKESTEEKSPSGDTKKKRPPRRR
jgi:hypothetical protein